MIKFNKPTNLNGQELLDELKNVGVNVIGLPFLDGNNCLWLDIEESDKAVTENVISEHNGTIIAPEPTIEDKLASVGLSLTDLKSALNLE